MRTPIPDALLERARRARCGLEVGAGTDFEVASTLAREAPQAAWFVSDVDPRVLRAPPPLVALRLDVTRADAASAPRADLVLGVRLPEELQAPAARLAFALGADLALRPLKDEWADVSAIFRTHAVWPHGWRFFPRDAAATRP